MQDSQENQPAMESRELYDPLIGIDQCLEPKFEEKFSHEHNESMKHMFTYEASAFKSSPRSNKLSISPPSNMGTPNEPVLTESMKIATGFVPKIKKQPSMENSPQVL